VTQPLADDVSAILAKLYEHEWWQGSLIHADSIADLRGQHPECEWWIVATQACNIYSGNFKSIPVIELIGANSVKEPFKYADGSHPREIDLIASHGDVVIPIRAESQKRLWIPRLLLADLPSPPYRLENRHTIPFSNESLWLEKFSSWIARGYTRVALPDEFNASLANSQIREILESRLAKKKHSDLYGIFLTINAEQKEESPEGPTELGLWKPPYDLGILIACYEDVDPIAIRVQLEKQLFKDEIKDPEAGSAATITRSALARRLGIRIIKEDIDVRSISDINLSELLGAGTVRYSMVDYHSDSSSTEV